MNLQIEQWPVNDLTPYSNNARTHSDDQVQQIANSISEFGFVSPILVGSDKTIIAGHGRLMAAKQLNMAEVPVIVLDHLTEQQRQALVIADNQITLQGGWDEELLAQEIQSLDDLDFDLELLGFDEKELNGLLEPVVDESNEDEVPEDSDVVISRLGDLWLLGKHRLLCGDSTKQDDVNTVLDGQLADMAFLDPPYNIDYGNTVRNKIRGNNNKILNDNLGDQFYAFLLDACTHVVSTTKGCIYIAMSSSELDTLKRAFVDAGGKWSTFIIWAKNHFTMGRSDYQRQYEPMLYGWKDGNDHYWCGDRNQSDIWFVDKPARNDLHPTMKPVALVERAIRNSSKTDDLVLDTFGGSGTTLIACEKTNRQARLVELDPKYIDVIIKRWQEYSGKDAVHIESNKTYNDLLSASPISK
jgi:DNA modification methylase